MRKKIRRLINYFGEKKEKKRFSKPPIIIGGCARSGTTMLISILAAHPSIFAVHKEVRMFKKWAPSPSDSSVEIPRRMYHLYRYFLFHRIPRSCTRWCEKSAMNVRYIDKILRYYNNRVKIIHIVRDGRDVMTSIHPQRPDKYWVRPERWVRDVNMGLQYKEDPNVFTVKYEDIIFNFSETIQSVCGFLGEEFHENLKEWHNHTSIKSARGCIEKVQPIFSKSIGRWKKPDFKERLDYLMKFEGVSTLLRELGYE